MEEDQVMADESESLVPEEDMKDWEEKKESLEQEIRACKLCIASHEQIDENETMNLLKSTENDQIREASQASYDARKAAFESREEMVVLKIKLVEHMRKKKLEFTSK